MDYSGRYRPVRALRPDDDFNHPVEAHPFFNESRYVHLIDGGQRIGGWFRIGQRANQGLSEMTACVYLPDGRLGFIFERPAAVSQGAVEAAGMRFDVQEPLHRTRLRYEGPLFVLGHGAAMEDPRTAFVPEARVDARIDLSFASIAKAHGGELLGDDGGPFDEGEGRYFARAHYDQSVMGAGTVQVGGERWDVRGFGLRDHSWGPRIWQAIPWYRWFPCTFGPDLAICLMVARQASGELLETGFLHLGGGGLRHVSGIQLSTRYSDDGRHYPLGFTLSFTDEAGQRFDVQGETVACAPCRHWRKLPDGSTDKSRIMECMTRYTLDGRVGWGMAEYMDHLDAAGGGTWEGIRAGY
jgi:hypothetical protein